LREYLNRMNGAARRSCPLDGLELLTYWQATACAVRCPRDGVSQVDLVPTISRREREEDTMAVREPRDRDCVVVLGGVVDGKESMWRMEGSIT